MTLQQTWVKHPGMYSFNFNGHVNIYMRKDPHIHRQVPDVGFRTQPWFCKRGNKDSGSNWVLLFVLLP